MRTPFFTLFNVFLRSFPFSTGSQKRRLCVHAFLYAFQRFFNALFPFPQDHRKRRLLVHATYLLVLQEMVKSRRPTRPSRPGFRSKRVFLRREDTSTWQSFIDDPEFDKQTEPGDILALLLGQVFTRKIAAVHGSPQQGKSYTCDSGTLTKCKAVPACFASFMASNARICAGSRTT